MSNVVLELIHQVLGNIVHNFNVYQTYADKNDHLTGILAVSAFVFFLEINMQKNIYSGPICIWQWYNSPDKTYGGLGINTSAKSGKINNVNIRKK